MVSNGNSNGASHGPTPLKVVIVGAGIGGLTAAVSLRQAGHDVTILESSTFSQELGAGLLIAPYCNGSLKHLGIDLIADKNIGGNENTGCSIWPPFAPKSIYISYNEDRKRWQHSRVMIHRALLHTALREKALSEDGTGKPCKLRLSSRVLSVDPEGGEVVLVGGERVCGDMILGADGVHSQCRKALVGGKGFVPFRSEVSAFRFTIPMKLLRDDPVTAELIGPDGTLIAALTPGGIKRLICYPIADGTLMNYVFLHADGDSEIDDKSPASLKKLAMQLVSEFPPAFRTMLEKAQEDSMRLWPLLDLHELPTWVNGKMALLGDAAHPFLPHRNEGGSQAIDDAVSLGTVFYLGTPAEAVPERLALYERCRKERASKIQEASRIFSQSVAYQKKRGFDPHEFDNYSFSHDEHHASLQALRLLLKSKRPDCRMRMPISFGPAPGPCQPGNTIHGVFGSRPSDFAPRKTVRTIRFATSKTYLQNYLPTPALAFARADTLVQASLVCTSFRGLAWLAGHGYERVELRVHGVRHTHPATGAVVRGAFVPVVFESGPDAPLAGREERGAPVVPCDIDVATTDAGRSTAIALAWRGAVFGRVRLEGVAPGAAAAAAGPGDDEGLLMFRFVPGVGRPGGKPDAAYTVFEPFEGEKTAEKPEANGVNGVNGVDGHVEAKPQVSGHADSVRTQFASQASFEFTAGKWQIIPTLHHIVKNMQDIPVYDILEAKVEEIEGGSDEFSRVLQLD